MVKKYELPNEMLQLIGGAPELDFGMQQQNGAAQFATPDVRRSDLISALRGIPGPSNPGFTRYANQANGAGLTTNLRKSIDVKSPARLTLPKYIAPEVTLPGAEPPNDPPYVPPFVDKVIFNDVFDDDIIDDDIIDDGPDILDDPVEDVGTPIVDTTVVDTDPEDDPVDPDPDYLDPTDLDPFYLDPLIYPQDPTKERDGTVIIEPVDPSEEFPQDDGTTQDILDLINYLNSATPGGGTTGGGKSVFDETLGSLEF